MYCSTCGSRVPEGRSRCDACGTAVPRSGPGSSGAVATYAGAYPLPEPLSLCPRCGFRGQSISYFSRGGHVAALVALTVFTAGVLGVGGLGYYLLRREHRICPRCGGNWGKFGLQAMALNEPAGPPVPRVDESVAESGGGAGVGAWLLFILAALLILVGLVETAAVPVGIGIAAAVGGFAARRKAIEAREARRLALLSGLQLPVLKLAGERKGRLTVTEVASALGWTLPRAEKVLNSLEDGLRVVSDVTDEGVIVYEFRELMHGARLPSAEEMDALLAAPPPPPGERRLEA